MLAKGYKIHGAVLNNDTSAVKEILKNGTDINNTDKGGRTALHLAASYNSPVIQKLLSGPVVNTNIPDAVLKWTPLRYADRTKSWMAMDILLDNGANADDIVLNRPNSEAQECDKKALWECASKGHRKLLEFMLNCGTEVNAVPEVPENLQGKSSLLHIASLCCQVEVVRLLVERKADINIRNDRNDTALHLAAFSSSVEIINILLDKGMSIDLRNRDDCTPLHFSAVCGNLEATKTLVEKGAALNDTSQYGITPLILAAKHGELQVFRYLTEMGADINIRDTQSNTALHYAAYSGSVEIIKILLEKGMYVDLTNGDDSTPLHFSAKHGNLEATKALIEMGAALRNTNKNGDTPLVLAAKHGKIKVLRFLRKVGADTNICDVQINTVIYLAAYSDSADIFKCCRKMVCPPGPSYFPATFRNREAPKTLALRSADLGGTNKNSDTPLHLAKRRCKLKVFRNLTEIGADNIRVVQSTIAYQYAAISGSMEIINI
jgi:ankyrin repeat protein